MAATMTDANQPSDVEIEHIECDLLVEAIFRRYGYDFRDYSKAHLRRRLRHRLTLSGLSSMAEMLHQVLIDEDFFETLLGDLSIKVTAMFRDPSFYRAVRHKVLPVLKTYPHIRIWHAGCATGEEVYSMAILLMEAGLAKRGQLYATDMSQAAIDRARAGIFPMSEIKVYTNNYQQAEGQASFSDYYTAKYESVIMGKQLRERIIFAQHNLTSDGVFAEMHAIVCRNVLIYFNKELQHRVMQLFVDSLGPGGFLLLGSKENLARAEWGHLFDTVDEEARIYKKKTILEMEGHA
jgi:chemotaxis protein methyltransferase CheR